MLIASPKSPQGNGSFTERFPIRKITPGFHPGYLLEFASKLSFKEHVWTQGEILPGDHRAVAILGSRVCHPRAEKRSYDLAASLARRGVCIVSGLDVGICEAVHAGAVEATGRTLMVLPSVESAALGLAISAVRLRWSRTGLTRALRRRFSKTLLNSLPPTSSQRSENLRL